MIKKIIDFFWLMFELVWYEATEVIVLNLIFFLLINFVNVKSLLKDEVCRGICNRFQPVHCREKTLSSSAQLHRITATCLCIQFKYNSKDEMKNERKKKRL